VSGKHKKALNLSSELYTVTSGVQQLYSSVVGNLLAAMADLLLSLTFIIGILFVDVLTSVTVASLFILLAWALNSFFSPRARSNGKAVGELTRQSQQEVLDTIQLFREIRLRGVSDQHSEKITNTRRKLYRFLVPNQIYGMLNKYLIEGFLLLLVSVIAGILFLLYDASTGFAKLAIFFIASSRIAPALVRLQQSLFQAKNNIAQALETLEAIAEISEVNFSNSSPAPVMTRSNYGSPSPTIRVENLTYSYRGSRNQKSDWRLELQSLTISAGKVVAVVGHSGSGKTTLVDLLLGFKSPDTGSVRIDELSVQQIVSSLPGFLGYVPQDVYLMNSTIRENISLMDPRFDNEEEILRVLEIVGLRQWVDELPNGINTVIGTGSLTRNYRVRRGHEWFGCRFGEISHFGIVVNPMAKYSNLGYT
jgi:ABC-type multidrug transport system fused ATPase/permease subunit